MSSAYVRTTVKNWLSGQSIPFYNTVNEEVNPADDIWMTVDWGFAPRQVETYCRESVEAGNFNLVLLGRPGVGDDILIAAAETQAAVLLSRIDTSGKLVLLDYDAPVDFRQQDKFGVEVSFEYEYRG